MMRALLHGWTIATILTFGVVARGWPSQGPDLKTNPEVGAALKLLEAQLEADRAQLKIPGLSAAVVLDQEILWTRGFGYADVERRIPATPQTLYRVGSITKLFTATMLMQLREQGKLQLDDPLTEHLPELRRGGRSRELSQVTLRQLVSHTSGLPTEAPLEYWETLEFPGIETVLASLGDAQLAPPLTKLKYSNLGVALLGEALSRAAGQPYQVYVREQILNPLGMRSTHFEPTSALRPRVATGYTRYREGRARTIAPNVDLGFLVPAGGLYSSVQDIARFISLQFRDGREPAGGAQVLRGGAIREMHTVQWMEPDWQSAAGIGFGLSRVADRVVVGHAGGINGFNTRILLLPGTKLGVAVFSNTNTEGPSVRKALELLVPVLERVRGRMSPTDTTRAPAAWQRYAGTYEHTIGSDIEIRLLQNHLVLASPDAPGEPGEPLTAVGSHRFRLKDDSTSGELVIFELDAAGTARRVRVGPYVYDRKP